MAVIESYLTQTIDDATIMVDDPSSPRIRPFVTDARRRTGYVPTSLERLLHQPKRDHTVLVLGNVRYMSLGAIYSQASPQMVSQSTKLRGATLM